MQRIQSIGLQERPQFPEYKKRQGQGEGQGQAVNSPAESEIIQNHSQLWKKHWHIEIKNKQKT